MKIKSNITEKKLTKAELEAREKVIKDLKKNKSALVKRYGKDAEAVMYGRATNIAKKMAESENKNRIKELVRKSLMQEADIEVDADRYEGEQELSQASAMLDDLETKLNNHDWFYMMADDNRAYTAGSAKEREIRDLINKLEALGYGKDAKDMYNDKEPYSRAFGRDSKLKEAKGKDIDGDGDVDSQDYLAARDAAIKKAKTEKVDEMDINDPVLMKMRAAKMKAANAGDDGNDKFFAKNAARLGKLKALKDKRAEIMRDMEQEAEPEGGPIADKYGDMLNKLDKAIAMLQGQGEWGPEKDVDITAQEIGKRAAMIGLEEGSSTEEKRIAMSAVKRLAKYRGVSTEEAKADLLRAVKELGDLKEDLDLGHQDNEPHMLKGDLYRIGKYAMELYQMVDDFEGQGEVDFPHWWQAKIITAKNNLVGAKHYLDFETKEPQIDAAVDVIDMSGTLDNIGVEDEIEEIGMFHDPVGYKKSEPNPKDLIFTKKFVGTSDTPGHSGYIYDIYKNGVKIKTIEGEGNANAYINQLQRELNEEEPNETDMLAAKIAKALKDPKYKSSEDQNNIKQARKAMNDDKIEAAEKIIKPYLAEKIAKQLKSK